MQLSLIYAQFDMICIVIMVMITLKSVSLTRSLMLQRTYLLMMFFAMCLVCSDMIYELSDYGLFSLPSMWAYFFNIIYFASSLAISFTWYVYTLRLIGSKLAYNVIFRGLTGFPMMALIIMCFSTYYTKWIFYFDETGYHRGSLNFLIMLVPLLYFLSATIIALIYHLRYRTEESLDFFKTIVSFFIFPIVTVGIQVFMVGFPAVCIGASLGMLQVFLNNIAKDRENLIVHESIAKSKNEFFAGMSHEIRTPINAIIGMDTMILRESEDESIRDYAKSIDSSSKILLTLVNDILDISKIEAGKMRLLPVDYSMKEVIRDLVGMFEPRAKEKNLEFRTDIDRNLPTVVHGDEVRLKQIIINMMTNAVKYTATGSIKFIVRAVNTDNDTLKMHVAVQDTGCGMKKEQVEKIFSPYERFDEQLNRKTEGTGLGMSISKQLLTLMDSNMVVESKYGVGSTFSFTISLPIVDPNPIGDVLEKKEDDKKENTPKRSAYKPSFKAPGVNLLYVDDTTVNLKVFKALLKETQIVVDTALSGREALDMVSNKKYDIIFVDIMMPEMDGIETMNFMKKTTNQVSNDTPIIACTANALVGAREKYVGEGFNDYISKPIDARELEEMILNHIKKESIVNEEA